MSLLGIRDISNLDDAAAVIAAVVVTEVIPHDKKGRIKQAAAARTGAQSAQVFFVHNKVYNIQSVADEIRQMNMVPDARIVIGSMARWNTNTSLKK